MNDYLTIRQTYHRFKSEYPNSCLGEKAIRNAVRDGDIVCRKVGNRIYISYDEFLEYLRGTPLCVTIVEANVIDDDDPTDEMLPLEEVALLWKNDELFMSYTDPFTNERVEIMKIGEKHWLKKY